jgi:DNA-binding transcriptional LysR family regulator
MKIDVDGIQAFVLVADLGGFGKAAEALHLTQTALSRRLQKLETYLGMRLLDRTTRSVKLTAVGRGFLPQARKLVDELTSAVDRLKGMSRTAAGDITIACIPSMAYNQLPPIIREYAAAHPGNRIRILDLPGGEVVEAVRSGRAEFGITMLLAPHADLLEQPIRDDPFVFFCRTDHPLHGRRTVTWADLRGHDLVSVSGPSGNRLLLDHHLARRRIDVSGRFEVQHLSTAIGMVAAGVGAAILPASTIVPGTHPDVRMIPIVQPVVRRTLGVVQRRGAALSPAAQAFRDGIEAALGETARAAPKARGSRRVAPPSGPAAGRRTR